MMLFAVTFSALCSVILFVQAAENPTGRDLLPSQVCYGDYGCFKSGAPFGGTLQRPFFVLPDPPEKVGVKFYAFTRETRRTRTEVSRSTTMGPWAATKPTKIIVHGFVDNSFSQWWIDMKNAILDVDDVNVILTDWSKGNGFPYEKAATNTQIVGAEIAFLIRHLIDNYGATLADFHVIGHSLGSHIAGYAGKRLPGLARISALDPAGPYFENTNAQVRLNQTDAQFVDVLHTDGAHNLLLGLGTLQRMGHADFYPNGGFDQPKCSKTPGKIINLILQLGQMNIEGFLATSVCSHMAAVHFYTDTVRNQCPYVGYSCSNYDDFDASKCTLECSGNGQACNRMGYWASPSQGKGDLFLKTQDANAYPYCINHYQITLESGGEYLQTRGKVTLTLIGTLQTVTVVFDDNQTTFKRNSVETRLIPLTVDIGEVTGFSVQFTKTTNWAIAALYSSSWNFKKATVLDADVQRSRSFCQSGSVVESGSTLRFASC